MLRRRPSTAKTVVVAHHLPHPQSIAPAYVGHPINPALCSNLSTLVERGGAALWMQ
jgi:hypothetical protein